MEILASLLVALLGWMVWAESKDGSSGKISAERGQICQRRR